jgi:hypothetical protein
LGELQCLSGWALVSSAGFSADEVVGSLRPIAVIHAELS